MAGREQSLFLMPVHTGRWKTAALRAATLFGTLKQIRQPFSGCRISSLSFYSVSRQMTFSMISDAPHGVGATSPAPRHAYGRFHISVLLQPFCETKRRNRRLAVGCQTRKCGSPVWRYSWVVLWLCCTFLKRPVFRTIFFILAYSPATKPPRVWFLLLFRYTQKEYWKKQFFLYCIRT